MDDVKGFLKKYWPYIVGAIVGLYILLRYSSGGSSASGGSTDYAAFMNAQTQASSQNAALQGQLASVAAQQALDRDKLNAQIAYDNKDLDIKKNAVAADAFNAFQNSQAAMAQSLGTSASTIINALNTPAITAMSAGAIENAAALEAAGMVAANSFNAQGGMVASTNNAVGQIGSIMGNIMQSMMQPEQKTDWAAMINAGANAYSAYATGGLSGMNSGGSGYGVGYRQGDNPTKKPTNKTAGYW